MLTASNPSPSMTRPIRTLEEVAAILGISRVRVHQIEERALAKLRRNADLRRVARELGYNATKGVR